MAVFSASHNLPNSNTTNFTFFKDGATVTNSIRQHYPEASWTDTDFHIFNAADIDANGTNDVEVRWERVDGGGTLTCHERHLTLVKVDSGDIASDSSATSPTTTSTSFVTFGGSDVITVTPGVGPWMGLFSTFTFVGAISPGEDTLPIFAFHTNATENSDSVRGSLHEDSIDSTPISMNTIAFVEPTAGQAVDIRWKAIHESTALTLQCDEREMVLVREAAATGVAPVLRPPLAPYRHTFMR